jgi:mannosyl-glycoprotein endo-beta-N-acetylglucosaminidase
LITKRTLRRAGLAAVLAVGATTVLIAPSAFASTTQDTFIAASVEPAQTTHDIYDVPTSVTIAQAALESAWGGSKLSANDNNYFGMKCVSADSPGPIATGCHKYPTTECTPTCHTVDQYFRIYASRTASFRDYARVLTTNSVYAPALKFRHDPVKFIEAIAPHYATDPDYASKVEATMSAHDLTRYDKEIRNGGPAVRVGGKYHVFGIKTSNGGLYEDTFGTKWSGWKRITGPATGAPAVTYTNGRYDVFVATAGGAIRQRTLSGGKWSAWKSLGGKFGAGKGVAAIYENGKYHVFGITNAGILYENTFTTKWGGWKKLGGTLQGTPAVTYHGGRFDVFGISPANGQMYQKTYKSGAWGSWHSLKGGFKAGSGAAAIYDGKDYHVFGISSAGELTENTFATKWGGWKALGGAITGTPAVTYDKGRYDVFALSSTNGAMYHRIYSGGAWKAWASLGGDFR